MREDFDTIMSALISLLSTLMSPRPVPCQSKVLGCHYRGPEQKTWKSLSMISEMSLLGPVSVKTLRPQTNSQENRRVLLGLGFLRCI